MRRQGRTNVLGLQDTFSDKVFLMVVYFLLTVAALAILIPLIFIVAASFSDPGAVKEGKVLFWPVEPTLKGYTSVLKSPQIVTGFVNSLFYMVSGTAVNLFMTMICAFPLSRKDLYGRGFFNIVFLFTMYFSGGLVPSYLLISKLGLFDSRLVMILPGAMSVWFVIIARSFMQANIPDELFEAARIDGCMEIPFFIRIVLPLSGSVIAVLALYYGVAHWNAYFNAMLYLKSSDKYPLQLILRNILVMNKVDPMMLQDYAEAKAKQGLTDLLKYAVIVVSSIPVMIIYPFVQRHFVKGVMIGALKG